MKGPRVIGLLLLATLLLTATLAGWTTATHGWNVRTSLLDLLPRGEGKVRDLIALVEGKTGAELVVLVGHRDALRAQALAGHVRESLDGSGAIASRDDQAPDGMQQAWYESARDHLTRILPDSLGMAADRKDTALLARQILSGLYLPYSILPPSQDPFQIATQRLSGMSRPGWGLCGRRPCRNDGDTVWVLVRTRIAGSAFDATLQEALLPVLARERERVSSQGGVLLSQGVVLHAAHGRQETQGDMSRVGIGSALGILLILWLAFRTPTPFVASVGAVVIGLAAGVTLTHFAFGGIHAMTLAFGASITGLCADYALFILVRRAFEGAAWEPRRIVAVHWLPLFLALVTTLLSFLGLGASGFPGLMEIAVFSFTGLTTSWLAALVLLPMLFRRPVASLPGSLARLSQARGLAQLVRLRGAIGILALASAGGMLLLRGDDDVRRLQKPSAQLVEQDRRCSMILQGAGDATILMVEAAGPDSLLARLEGLDSLLGRERLLGRSGRWTSLSGFVPSQDRQRRDSLRQEALLAPPLREVPERLGIEPAALDSFAAKVRRPGPRIGMREWLRSDASWGSRDLLLDTLPWRSAVSVEGAGPGWKLPGNLPGIVQIDPANLYSTLLQGQRRKSAWLVAGMYLIVFLGLWGMLGFRRALAVLAPPVVAAAATLGVLGWLGVPLHFFGLMALTLVLGAGVDYALFLEARASQDAAGYATVILCAATALLSFGVLFLAASPALSQFGLVTGVGLTWAMLLSPWAPFLSGGERE